MTPQRILVVEDDRHTARLIGKSLAERHYKVDTAHDVATAIESLGHRFDLIILDLGLPDGDGLDLCRTLRNVNKLPTPILMLSSRSAEADRVLGLEVGADDYLVKPFGYSELLARVRSLLRRTQVYQHGLEAEPECHETGNLRVDVGTRSVRRDGQEVDLTAKEFDILLELLRHPGHVYRRRDFLRLLWGSTDAREEHAVSCQINRLRNKLEDEPHNPKLIVTVWGVGYKLNADAA